MIAVRKSADRGFVDHGWLQARHTFSFGSYYDPDHMGFGSLRVMNEDRIAPGKGFGTHPHRDMEIVTYVLEGALEHRDSMGNGEVLRPGEFQRMSAGTGITHSEFNPSGSEPTHLYQIWLQPSSLGVTPSYEQKRFDDERIKNRLGLVASPQPRDGALEIGQDVHIFLGKFTHDSALEVALAEGRQAWLQVLRGAVELNDLSLAESDGAAISDLSELRIRAHQASELMLLDMA